MFFIHPGGLMHEKEPILLQNTTAGSNTKNCNFLSINASGNAQNTYTPRENDSGVNYCILKYFWEVCYSIWGFRG